LTCKLNFNWNVEKELQYKKLKRALDDDVFQWSIVLKDSNECIGQICVQEKDKDKSIRDIGWFINPTYQRKGYAYEAALKVLDYMFNEVEIEKIDTGAAVCNPASWKLMEKLGFVRGSEQFQVHYTFGGDVLCYSYSLGRKEYFLSHEKIKKWKFGTDNEKLIDLVWHGKKRATTSLFKNEAVPILEESIILHDDSSLACKVRIKKVIITRFKDITRSEAKLEGERDLSLEYWREVHKKFLAKEMDFNDETLVVMEIFEVVRKY